MEFAFGLFGLFFLIWAAAIAVWIVGIVDVVKIPEHQFRAAGTDKTTWVLIVVLAQAIGAIIWFAAKRSDVRAAAGWPPAPAPGWYPDAAGGVRWWDGARWSEAHHAPPVPWSS
jgi:hypothetical protein